MNVPRSPTHVAQTAQTEVALPEPFVDVGDELADGLDVALSDRRDGKVRVSYRIGRGGPARRLFVTTDRLSAFDRVIAGIPYKGQVLNQLAAWWFERTADIVAHHIESVPDPNLTVAVEVDPLPVEVIVRGAITGVTATSLWQRYAAGARRIDGHDLPEGLGKNTLLPAPIVTPTTKPPAGSGLHDEPLSVAEVAERGLVAPGRWDDAVAAALALFERGQRLAEDAGLMLADTKYEFGVDADGCLRLIDEVHTPDSSRFWIAESYERRLGAGEEPESLDKEAVRLALAAAGYRGDGVPPPLAPAVVAATTARYISAYERLTATSFVPGEYPVGERLHTVLGAIA